MADCTHPVQVAGLCAVCGRELEGAALQNVSIQMSHASAGIKVSASEAKRLDAESTAQLLRQRRLALIIDLDQTIIHATVDPTVGDWLQDTRNPNHRALHEVGRFKLGMDGKTVLGFQARNQISDADDSAPGCWYYVKPRPGLARFLRHLTEKYELHVYTMGTRSYADCVCRLVDPDGTLFGSRILSRDENGSLLQKSLSRLFPIDHSMVVIIDDRSDVWSRSPNLIKVNPYDFFVGIGDINATFLPDIPALPGALSDEEAEIAAEYAPDGSAGDEPAAAAADGASAEAAELSAAVAVAEEKAEKEQQAALSEQIDSRPLAKMQEQLEETANEGLSLMDVFHGQAVLKDEDDELRRVQGILDSIHSQWYTQWDGMHGSTVPSSETPEQIKALVARPKPAVMSIISEIKRRVFAGCDFVFSGVIPLGEKPQEADIWRTAEEFGAKCSLAISKAVTHLIAAKAGTEKARQAARIPSIQIVHPQWLHTSVAQWAREEEQWYILQKDSTDSPAPPAPGAADGHASDGESSTGEPAAEEDEGAADAEEPLAAVLPAELAAAVDWGEANDEVDAYLDDSDDDDGDTEASAAPSRQQTPDLAKRARTEDGDEEPADPQEGSPLSKRRRMAEARAGKSMLKHSVGEDGESDDESDVPDLDGDAVAERDGETSQAGTDLDAFADDLELELEDD